MGTSTEQTRSIPPLEIGGVYGTADVAKIRIDKITLDEASGQRKATATIIEVSQKINGVLLQIEVGTVLAFFEQQSGEWSIPLDRWKTETPGRFVQAAFIDDELEEGKEMMLEEVVRIQVESIDGNNVMARVIGLGGRWIYPKIGHDGKTSGFELGEQLKFTQMEPTNFRLENGGANWFDLKYQILDENQPDKGKWFFLHYK